MPWNPIAIEDVQAEILPDEVTLLNAIQGSADILTTILGTSVAEIQAQILVGGNQVGQPGTVPDQIRGDCIAFVRWKWFCSLPKTDLQSEFRRSQHDESVKRFQAIREGREKVEIPANPQNLTGPSMRMQTIRRGKPMQDFSTLGET
jgi:hypothetical protein